MQQIIKSGKIWQSVALKELSECWDLFNGRQVKK